MLRQSVRALGRFFGFRGRQDSGSPGSRLPAGGRTADRSWIGRARLIAGLMVVLAAVIETSTRSILAGPVFGDPLPLLPAFLGGVAVLVAILLAHDRRRPFLGLWFGGDNEAPSPARPRLDTALAAGCLMASLALVGSFVWPIDKLLWPVDKPIVDLFHEGEFLAGLPIARTQATIPLLIHGPGRNILPGALAMHFAEPGYGIAFIRLVTNAGTMLTALALAGATAVAVAALLPESAAPARRRMWMAAAALCALLFAWKYASMTNRHVLFLAALALTLWMAQRAGRSGGGAALPAFLLGAVVAVAPVHVYAAAIEAAAVAAAGGAIVLMRHRIAARWTLGAALAGLVSGFGVVLALGGGSLYETAIRDILFWAGEGRGIWALPTYKSGRMLFGIIFMMIVCALVVAIAWRASRSESPVMRTRGVLYWVLAVALVIASRSFIERSDWPHLGIAFVTLAVVVGVLAVPAFRAALTRSPAWARIGVAGLAIAGVASGAPGLAGLVAGGPAALRTPDSALLPAAVAELVARYQAPLGRQDCLLVLTNEGVINYAAALPPCGGVFYPVYWSTPAGDARLAAWLEAHPQRIVVSDTDFWSGAIDGRPMAERLPRTYALIERTMPVEESVGGRVVRLAPPG